MDTMVPLSRQALVWFGSLLLHHGHTVEVPEGDHELVVHKKKPRRIRVQIRDEIDLSKPRTAVGTMTELDGELPDVVVLVLSGRFTFSYIHVVPVARTRDKWIAEGRHYVVPTEQLVPFGALDAWLSKLP
jgi:hypothetical protein